MTAFLMEISWVHGVDFGRMDIKKEAVVFEPLSIISFLIFG